MDQEIYDIWLEGWTKQRIERGLAVNPPSKEQMERILDMFDIPLKDLFGLGTQEGQPK